MLIYSETYNGPIIPLVNKLTKCGWTVGILCNFCSQDIHYNKQFDEIWAAHVHSRSLPPEHLCDKLLRTYLLYIYFVN